MRIISLKAENVKRLSAVEIHPDGNLVTVGGRNAQGKSSVLDSIMMALGGAGALCDEPLRRGATSGDIVADLGEFVVHRHFDEKGGTKLVVKSSDGGTLKSPQSILDGLTGKLAFDPLSFTRMDKHAQLATLKKLVGLDFTELEAKRLTVFEKRTQVGRDGQARKADREAMPFHPGVPEEEISTADVVAEIEKARQNNATLVDAETKRAAASANIVAAQGNIEKTRDGWSATPDIATAQSDVAKAREMISITEAEIATVRAEIDNLQRQLATLESSGPSLAHHLTGCIDALETAVGKAILGYGQIVKVESDKQSMLTALIDDSNVIDIAPLLDKAKTIDATNRKIRDNQAAKKAGADIIAKRAEWDDLTAIIDALDARKAKEMSEAKFPVPGLSFDATQVLFSGIPFSQSSQAEQVRVSMAMSLAMNPKLRIVLIRDGSCLDRDGMRIVAEMAEQYDAQVWVEVVSDTGEGCSVVIEDGQVQAVAHAG